MLRILVEDTGPPHDTGRWDGIFSIHEDQDGQLVWNYICKHGDLEWRDGEYHIRCRVRRRVEGLLTYAPIRTPPNKWGEVTPEDAEDVTGLHMPAAMDRLRELVQEAR